MIKKHSNMIRRTFLFIAALFFSANVFSQAGYRLDVRQVFPTSAVVFSNSFDIRRDLDNAVASQTARLRGNSGNYKLQIKTPSGSEIRYVQNIIWVESINGNKTYHKAKTYPKDSYSEPTTWEGYGCNIEGGKKESGLKYEFRYRVSNTVADNDNYGEIDGKGSANAKYETPFIKKDQAIEEADRIYGNSFRRDCRVEVVVYCFTPGKEYGEKVYDKTNEKEYREYIDKELAAKKQREQEKIRQENMRMVGKFRTDMAGLKAKTDSVKVKDSVVIKTLLYCRTALEQCKISDSLFFNEKLDTVYQKTVLDVLQPYVKKKYKEAVNEKIAQMTDEATKKSKEALLSCLRKIEEILIPVKEKKGK